MGKKGAVGNNCEGKSESEVGNWGGLLKVLSVSMLARSGWVGREVPYSKQYS